MPAPEMNATQSHFDLLDMIAEPGCPVCAIGLRRVAHYIDAVNYDSVGDHGIRAQLRASLGYCNTHAHQWLHTAFVLGTAKIYNEVLGLIDDDLRALQHHDDAFADRVAARLLHRDDDEDPAAAIVAPTGSCPVCQHLADTETLLIRTLLRSLREEPAFREAYQQSTGLCLPHLRMALAASADHDIFDLLRQRALDTQSTLRQQLQEIIRKHDYRFQHEPPGAEKGAAERAVAHVAGAPRIAKLQVM